MHVKKIQVNDKGAPVENDPKPAPPPAPPASQAAPAAKADDKK